MTTTVIDERQLVLELYRDHVNPGLASLAAWLGAPVEVRSAGALVYAADGTEYLDCGGYGTFFLGHAHPRVVAAVVDQVQRHPLSVRGVLEPRLAQACRSLVEVAPAGLQFATLTCSGAEAVELGLKLARLNGRRRVITTTGGFHGKTLGALSVTGRDRYRVPAAPLLPGVEFIPYGNADALTQALAHDHEPAVVIMEPIQAEGGVISPPPGFLSEVRRSCDRHGALLIMDEIQTGLGRTGRWWAVEREDVRPDILLTGKALSGGVVPVGAVISTAEAFAPLAADPLLHSSTFGGSPLAAAAASAALAVIEEEDLVRRAAARGAHLLGEIAHLIDHHDSDVITEVRGQGLLIGLECRDPGAAGALLAGLLGQRVLVSYSLNAGNVIRLTPPAVITDQHVDRLLTALTDALSGLHR